MKIINRGREENFKINENKCNLLPSRAFIYSEGYKTMKNKKREYRET